MKLGQYINKKIVPKKAIKFELYEPVFYLHFKAYLFLKKKEQAIPKYAPNMWMTIVPPISET